jgi:hypothetical protein
MAPGLVSRSVVLDEQQVDHQADHLARGEVLTRRLVGQLGEAPDQLLVQVAHLQVGHLVGVQVDLGELGHHQVEQPRAIQPVDLGGEVELVEHVAGRSGEAGDVVLEVVGQVVRGGDQRGEVEPGGVVELLAGLLLEDRVEVVVPARQLRGPVEHGLLGGLEHAVQAAQHGEGEDHLAVLGLLVVAAQQVGDRPDERGVVLDGVRITRRHGVAMLPGRECPWWHSSRFGCSIPGTSAPQRQLGRCYRDYAACRPDFHSGPRQALRDSSGGAHHC